MLYLLKLISLNQMLLFNQKLIIYVILKDNRGKLYANVKLKRLKILRMNYKISNEIYHNSILIVGTVFGSEKNKLLVFI